MGLTLITQAANPVTLDEAKAWCRVDGTAEDAVLEMLLAGAFEQVQTYCGRALTEQTWNLVLDGFADAIELPKGPVTAITAFTYVGTDGVTHAVDPSLYTLDLVTDPQFVVLDSDASWPATLAAVNVVTVQFKAGYAEIPAPLKIALLTLVNQWFDDRVAGAMPASVREQLAPYRRMRI